MENPRTWGRLEQAISLALSEFDENSFGLSMEMTIANVLRREALVVDEQQDQQVGHDSRDGAAG